MQRRKGNGRNLKAKKNRYKIQKVQLVEERDGLKNETADKGNTDENLAGMGFKDGLCCE